MTLDPLAESRTRRQQEFIDVAARLFARRGYHSVGINEISAELGLSGPAIYRHYASKESLLVAVLDESITSHLEEVRDIVSSLADPHETLDTIVQHHIRYVLDQTENIVTWRTEFRSLPDADRHRLRYLQRLYIEEWVRTVRKLRPDLEDDEVRAMCHAVIALIQSPTEFHYSVPRPVLEQLLASMATVALSATWPKEDDPDIKRTAGESRSNGPSETHTTDRAAAPKAKSASAGGRTAGR